MEAVDWPLFRWLFNKILAHYIPNSSISQSSAFLLFKEGKQGACSFSQARKAHQAFTTAAHSALAQDSPSAAGTRGASADALPLEPVWMKKRRLRHSGGVRQVDLCSLAKDAII